MKSFRLLGGIALLAVLLVALLASTPARLLQRVLPGQQVVLSGVQGTLWEGSASRAIVQLAPGYLHLGAVRWSLSPLSLLTLSPRLELQSAWGAQRVTGNVVLRGQRDLDLRDVEAQLDADLLRKFAPLAVDGFFSAQLQQLSLRDGLPHSAQGRVVWQQAGFQSPRGRVPLGSYALDFTQAPGEALQGEILTLNGPMLAEGRARLEGRAYSINVLLRSEGAMDPVLKEALQLMAMPEGDGYRLQLSAEL